VGDGERVGDDEEIAPALERARDIGRGRADVEEQRCPVRDQLGDLAVGDGVKHDDVGFALQDATQRLAEHHERTGTAPDQVTALRRWRDAYRTKIAGYPQTLLGASSDPTPAGDLQAAWVGSFVAATWMLAAAAGLLPLALGGFVVLVRRESLQMPEVVTAILLGLLLAGLPWLLLGVADEWMLRAVRLGFPWNPDDARIPGFAWAAAGAGLALPILIAATARRWRMAVTAPAFALPILALACWLAISRADARRADYIVAAARAHEVELTSPVPDQTAPGAE